MKTLLTPFRRPFPGSALWAGLLVALLASSCESGGDTGNVGAGSGSGSGVSFEELDLVGTWELEMTWHNPQMPQEGISILQFLEGGISPEGDVVFLESWSQPDGADFTDMVIAHDLDLRSDGDFTMWIHYEISGNPPLLGSLLFSGPMTQDKGYISGMGNDHGAQGDPEGISGAWDEDFSFSLSRL